MAVLKLYVLKNDEIVATSVDDKGLPDKIYSWQNNSATIMYREKPHTDAYYKLCYDVSDDMVGRKILPGWFQFGYQVWGTGHSFVRYEG